MCCLSDAEMANDADDKFGDDEASTSSTGALACIVLDLCEHAQNRLTKAAFVRLAQASARLLLVAIGTDETLTDVNGETVRRERGGHPRDLDSSRA